jgi:hypothetical protein
VKIIAVDKPKEPSQPPEQTDWMVKSLGNWKRVPVWEVYFRGELIGNAFGNDPLEAALMAWHTKPNLPRPEQVGKLKS